MDLVLLIVTCFLYSLALRSTAESMDHEKLFNHTPSLLQILKNITVGVVTYETEKVYGQVNPESGLFTGEGAAERILSDIQFIAGFRIKLRNYNKKELNDNRFKYFEYGVGSSFNSSEWDLAIGYFYVRKDRLLVASATFPIMTESLFVYFTQPRLVRNIYTSTLGFQGLAIFLLLLALSELLRLKLIANSINSAFRSAFDLIFSTVVLSTLKSSTRDPSIALLVGSLLSTIMYVLFSTKLTSVLLNTVKPVKDLNDMVFYGYKFYTMVQTVGGTSSAGPVRNVEYRYGYDKNADYLSENIRERQHALVDFEFNGVNGLYNRLVNFVDNPSPEDEIRGFCSAVSVMPFQGSSIFTASAFYYRKGWEHKDVVNVMLLKVKSVGLSRKYLQDMSFNNSASGCQLMNKISRDPWFREDLKVTEISSAFYILLVGAALAFMFLILEVIVMKTKPRK